MHKYIYIYKYIYRFIETQHFLQIIYSSLVCKVFCAVCGLALATTSIAREGFLEVEALRRSCRWEAGPWEKGHQNLWSKSNSLKINMEHNHGGLVQIIFLSKWMICIFFLGVLGCAKAVLGMHQLLKKHSGQVDALSLGGEHLYWNLFDCEHDTVFFAWVAQASMLAEIAVPEFKFGLAMGCTSRLNLNYMSNFQNLRNRRYYISGHHVSRSVSKSSGTIGSTRKNDTYIVYMWAMS